MIGSWLLPVEVKYIFGLLICPKYPNKYGKDIKAVLKVLSGIKKDTYWQAQLLMTHKYLFGLRSLDNIF